MKRITRKVAVRSTPTKKLYYRFNEIQETENSLIDEINPEIM